MNLMKPSTRAFFRESRKIPGNSLFDRLHGYVYARWPYLYIAVATGEHPVSRFLAPLRSTLSVFGKKRTGAVVPKPVTFADTYHGKVVPPETAKRLITLNRNISLTAPEQVIPYARARDIVLKNPGHIAVLDCPCRASRPHPCLPLGVCLIIGEPFASFMVEHHPRRARSITVAEASDILEAEHARGHVHHAFFKDAMLNRFYAICNCCPCCCGAMQAMRNGIPMLASSGYVCRVDRDRCRECGVCAKTCPFGAVRLAGDCPQIDERLCMGCGVCVSKCSSGALSLARDPVKGEPLDIQELMIQSDKGTFRSS